MATLYGIVIPPGAAQVEVRPVFGRGQRRLMYRGPVQRDGVDITEDVIADHVATDAAFWEYVAAQVRTKVLQAPPDGAWQFRLSVCFQDQHGAPATLDPDSGITSRVTAEAWEFYRAAASQEDASATGVLANTLGQLATKQADAQSAQSQAMAEMAKTLSSCVKEIAATAIQQSMAPLMEAQKLIADNARRAEERADGLAVDLFKNLTTRPKTDTGSGFGLLRDLLGVAKEAKTLLN